jgi:SagB-type dehydrogenase family enzyme
MSDDRFLARIASADLIVDEVARDTFKAQKLGLRRDLDGHPFVPLSAPRGPAVVSLGDRRSYRMFGSGPVSFEDLSELLGVLCVRPGDASAEGAQRGYASAGSAYPVQTFVLTTGDVEGVPCGLYYHHPEAHRLVLVHGTSTIEVDDHFPANRAWMSRAKLLVVLVARLAAIRPLYGEKARDFALLEAGQMVQLLQSMSARCAVGLCQSGVLDDTALRGALGLEPTDEIVGVLAGGPIPRVAEAAAAPVVVAPSLRPPPSVTVPAPAPHAATAPDPARSRSTASPALRQPPEVAAAAHTPHAVTRAVSAGDPPPRGTSRARRIEGELGALWCELLGKEQIDREAQFFDIGATSIVAARAVRSLQERYASVELGVADVFSHPTIRELAAAIDARLPGETSEESEVDRAPPVVARAPVEVPQNDASAALSVHIAPQPVGSAVGWRSDEAPAPSDASHDPIAIIGLAVEVPGADSLERLWANLMEGRSFVGPMPAARLELVPGFVTRPDQQYVAAYLDHVDTFAPLFFHMSPREAERVDPLQRLMLMVAAQAVAHAGYWRDHLAGMRAGVYVGASHSGYADLIGEQHDLTRMLPGSMTSVVAGRISHFFDLRGPSMVIDTACSSSLVAIDQACRALVLGDVDLAIAGGVNVILAPRPFEAFRQDGMESAWGACRTFDAGADGFVRGEGAAAVVLKRLSQAIADGDHVHAVICGTASNHDGRTSALPVPSPRAQRDVILEAHRRGGTSPRQISYVEAHGTGTPLGDPIELRGLTDAFRMHVPESGVCALGSIKTNLGHLELAAGVVGLAKTVLALQHEVLPANLHFESPNPHIELERTPFYVLDRARPWPRRGAPRMAGISSFGVGGTNAHVVLAEAPADAPLERGWQPPAHLFVLSADRPDDLWATARAHVVALSREALDMGDVCATLATGRPHQAHRLAIVASDRDALVATLSAAILAEGRPIAGLRVVSGRVADAVPAELEVRARALHARLPEAAQRALRSYTGETAALSAVRQPGDDDAAQPTGLSRGEWLELLELVGALWVCGADVRLERLWSRTRRRKVPLPGFTLARQRCWWPAPAAAHAAEAKVVRQPEPAVPPAQVLDPAPIAPAPIAAALPLAASTEYASSGELSVYLRRTISEAMRIPLESVGLKQPLVELGMDSLAAVELLDELSAATGHSFPPSFFFEYPTIAQMAAALEARQVSLGGSRVVSEVGTATAVQIEHAPAASTPVESPHGRAVAIIGMAGRFPGAPDVDAFWRLLHEGRHAITPVPATRWPGGTLQGGFLDDLDGFDPRFFRLSDREARWMDPQQRLLLMTAWEAVEDAGVARSIAGTRTGVYVGASYTHRRDRLAHQGHTVDEAHAALGNHNAILANRLSYFLDVRGPCLTIDTLCSSSLVALSAAVRSLREGECTQAIVAGVHADLSPAYYQAVSRLGALSADGRCRAFGAGASGYVPGEGVAVVVLKPLERAVADGDHIHAVIRGVAVNHGGQAAGLTVPNPVAQAEVIVSALRDGGVEGASVSYVEAHGTGTELGDPIELSGLERALGQREVGACVVGSVKSNIGHLEPAAGMASLIKVALMLRESTIVPTLFVDQPNPRLELSRSPLRLATVAQPWVPRAGVRRAGISSFGLGGVNAHLIVEEAPVSAAPRVPSRGVELVPLSAASPDQLLRLVERWSAYLAGPGASRSLLDIAYTATVGRTSQRHRAALLAPDLAALRQQLAMLAERLRLRPPAGGGLLGAAGSASQAARAEQFLAAQDVDLAQAFEGSGARRVPLPPTPFELRCFEYPAARSVAPTQPAPRAAHPLMGAPTVHDGHVTFEVELPMESTL